MCAKGYVAAQAGNGPVTKGNLSQIGRMVDRIRATVTGTVVSGFIRKWTAKDGKSGETARVYILRDGRNSPDTVDMPPELFEQLQPTGRYALTVLIRGRYVVGESGGFVTLDLWCSEADPLPAVQVASVA